ncbi:unnamed protein product [Rotaria sordida]|uniref:Uncharacterized protein n=1 Tax=Rotaria sordida TaxID=392033 RepID=A0A815L728_9BILA|nr:unnamed protein product [Rotaria sordida]
MYNKLKRRLKAEEQARKQTIVQEQTLSANDEVTSRHENNDQELYSNVSPSEETKKNDLSSLLTTKSVQDSTIKTEWIFFMIYRTCIFKAFFKMQTSFLYDLHNDSLNIQIMADLQFYYDQTKFAIINIRINRGDIIVRTKDDELSLISSELIILTLTLH